MPFGKTQFHADDFCMTERSSARIWSTFTEGALQCVSVMPNGCAAACLTDEVTSRLGLCIHINLVEGAPVSDAALVPLLVNEHGTFRNSFEGLFAESLKPGHAEFARQVYIEIKAQIEAVRAMVSKDTPLGIDSHQHTHMIPLIFDQMVAAVKDTGLTPAYVRFPAEPLSPGFSSSIGRREIAPINVVKALLLKFLGSFRRRRLEELGWQTAVFFGVLYSGRMGFALVEDLLPRYREVARRRNQGVEVLFHPGFIEPDEEFLDPYKVSFQEFYLDKGRRIEMDALKRIRAEGDA